MTHTLIGENRKIKKGQFKKKITHSSLQGKNGKLFFVIMHFSN